MPAPLEIIVTTAGRAAIVNAQNTGTAPVTITQIGLSGTAVTPLPAATALTGEFKRVASIAGEVVADDTIHVTLTDGSGDAYSLRSIGLYLADGTLFGIYGQPAPILEKTAQSIASLSIDIIFADIAAAAITFGNANFTNPPATTERQGVVELSTIAEAQAGLDALRALTPATAKAAILGWLLAQDGAGSGLDADLLDGKNSTWFEDIVGRLGFMPWGPNNDGSGSGLDAGLLAGQLPSYYTNITQRLGYLPANKGGDTFSGPVGFGDGNFSLSRNGLGHPIVQFDQAGDYVVFDRDSDALVFRINHSDRMVVRGTAGNLDLYSAQDLFFNANRVWHGANDGAGSGLDADLLDGKQADEFFPKTGGVITGYPRIRYNAEYMGIGLQSEYSSAARPGNIFFDAMNELGIAVGNLIYGILPDGSSEVAITLTGPGARNVDRRASAMIMRGPTRALDFYANSIWRNGTRVWDAGSDGSGSGLDADLLDGFDSSAFERIVDQNLTQNGGFTVYASGRKECWGFVDVAKDATATITLPVNHTSWHHPMASATATGIGQTDNTGVSQIVNANQFRIVNGNAAQRVYWRSVGV